MGDGSLDYPKELKIPKDVKVSSVCTGSTSHSLTLEFDDSKLVFTFKANDATDVQLTLAYTFTPSRLFPNKSKDAITVSQTHPLDLKINSTENKSYLCKADQSLELTAKPANLTVAFKNMQLQAYQLKNQTFGDAEECSQDYPTTTSSPTTQSTTVPSTMPSTIPPTMPPMPDIPTVYNYTVHESNKSELICLYLEAAMELKITYETVNKKNATQLIILGEADSGGQCGNSAETLTLSYSTANITMTFTLALTDKEVDLRHVALNYTLTPSVFPDVKNPEEIQIETNFKEKIWQYPQSDYFTCTANQSINFNGSQAILFTDKLKVKAFNNNDKPDVTGKAYTQCEADTSTSAIVPIAVGAALAALVVIVLVAYLIGRRRSNRGYESV